MASITAALRLRFFADDSPLRQAISTMRQASAAAGGMRGSLGFDKSAKAFQLAGNINQAASSMQSYKMQLDQVTQGPIQDFADFEMMMARVKSRTDNITPRGFAELEAAAKQAGASTMFTATQAAEGLFELSGAGLSAEQQIAALTPTLQLAQSGQVSLAQAASLAVNTMAQYGLTVKDLPMVNDLLNQAANASTIGLSELGDTFQYVGPIAQKAGLDLKQSATFAALLGNAGIVGSSAGTSLRAMLARLATQSPRATKALREVGMSGKDAARGLEDPIGFLKDLGEGFANKKLDSAKQLSVLMRVFGDEAAPAVAALLDAGTKLTADGTTGFDKMSKTMENYAGSTQRAASAIESTNAAKLEEFKSGLEGLSIELGQNFAPALVQMQKDLGPVVQGFGTWIKENPRLVSTIGRVMVTTSGLLAVMIPLAMGVASAVTIWGTLGPAVRLAFVPLRAAGGLLTALRTQLLATGTAAGTMGAMMTGAVGLGAAAFAGWQLGTLLDGWTAKMLGLREATLSAFLAVETAESGGMNAAIESFAETWGLTDLANAARANQQITESRPRTSQRGVLNPTDLTGGVEGSGIERRNTRTPSEVPQVNVKVDIEDKRTVVKQTTSGGGGGTTLRTGSN
jgi:TP901 family phage tail tape measure protein